MAADKQDEVFDVRPVTLVQRSWSNGEEHLAAQVVDEGNRVVGQRRRRDVHAEGLLHRAVYCFLFDRAGLLLLQQRAKEKQICPSCWDMSVAEHLEPGESYRHAAARGLQEELGVRAREAQLEGPLVPVHPRVYEIPGSFCDRELVTSFRLNNFEGELKADAGEVAGYRWVRPEDAFREAQEAPDTFTPWCRMECGLLDWFRSSESSACAVPQRQQQERLPTAQLAAAA